MFDIDLLYVKYRQQELWQEAAARALATRVHPARRPFRAWVQDALQRVRAAMPWRRAATHDTPGAAPAVHTLAPHGQSGTHCLGTPTPGAANPGAHDRVYATDPVRVGTSGTWEGEDATAGSVPATVAR